MARASPKSAMRRRRVLAEEEVGGLDVPVHEAPAVARSPGPGPASSPTSSACEGLRQPAPVEHRPQAAPAQVLEAPGYGHRSVARPSRRSAMMFGWLRAAAAWASALEAAQEGGRRSAQGASMERPSRPPAGGDWTSSARYTVADAPVPTAATQPVAPAQDPSDLLLSVPGHRLSNLPLGPSHRVAARSADRPFRPAMGGGSGHQPCCRRGPSAALRPAHLPHQPGLRHRAGAGDLRLQPRPASAAMRRARRTRPSPADPPARTIWSCGQSEVGIDLATGYTGELIIDGETLVTREVVAPTAPTLASSSASWTSASSGPEHVAVPAPRSARGSDPPVRSR